MPAASLAPAICCQCIGLVGQGARLRLRIELQIGYKNLKHLSSIELVDSVAAIGAGRGGLFEQDNYQWYAGQ